MRHLSFPVLFKFILAVFMLLATVVASGKAAGASSAPTASIQAEIEGQPTLAQSQALQKLGVTQDVVPVEGAQITIGSLGLVATTDGTGRAEIDGVPVSADLTNVTRLDIVVSASGYATFTYHSAPVSTAGLILTPVLSQVAQVDDLTAPSVSPSSPPAPSGPSSQPAPSTTSCSGWTVTSTPPNVIRVYSNNPHHGADYHIHTIDFQSYVQHVLPREWMSGWPTESLRAGAMAVKMFGWYMVNNWNPTFHTSEGCYDVDSLNSQTWDPNIGATDTNKAVLDTWDYYLVYSSTGTPYFTGYGSGYQGDACGSLDGQSPPWMSQWGTVTCANPPLNKVWYDILLNWYYTANNGSPASTLVHGPSETASTAENLPVLAPYAVPYSNSQFQITWGGTSGVDYVLCFDGSLLGEFSIYCTDLGIGVGSRLQGVPTGDASYLYYRLLACQNGYCSAIRAGGVENRTPSGNNFYGTASYVWPYAVAYVAEHNYSSITGTAQLWDGVPGFGGTPETTCNVTPSSTCGPSYWLISAVSWYVTVTQYIGGPTDTAPIRLLPTSTGE